MAAVQANKSAPWPCLLLSTAMQAVDSMKLSGGASSVPKKQDQEQKIRIRSKQDQKQKLLTEFRSS